MNTTQVKQSATNVAIKAVTGIFGAAHFIAQTSADIICHTEAKILCANGAYDKPTVIAARRAQTKLVQQQVISKVNLSKRRVDQAKASVLAKYNSLNQQQAEAQAN
jgi:ABC-type transporter Mla MlaB component